MTGTNHLLTGALIAVLVPSPALAIVCAIASHFVMDALPHFGFSYIPERARDQQKNFLRLTSIDATVSLLIFLLLPYLLRNQRTPIVTMLVMLASQVPDTVWAYRRWRADRTGRYAPQSHITRFHKWIQWCERPWGASVEVLWGGVVIVLLRVLAL